MDIKMTVDKVKFTWAGDNADSVWLDMADDDGWVGVTTDADCEPECIFPREVLIKMADYLKRLDSDVVD